MNIDLTEVLITAACVTGAVLAIGQFSGCVGNNKSQDVEKLRVQAEQTQTYLNNGCRLEPILGAHGTHWVCDGEKK